MNNNYCVLCFSQANHSQFLNPAQVVGNMAMLPLRTQFKGPAAKESKCGSESGLNIQYCLDQANKTRVTSPVHLDR